MNSFRLLLVENSMSITSMVSLMHKNFLAPRGYEKASVLFHMRFIVKCLTSNPHLKIKNKRVFYCKIKKETILWKLFMPLSTLFHLYFSSHFKFTQQNFCFFIWASLTPKAKCIYEYILSYRDWFLFEYTLASVFAVSIFSMQQLFMNWSSKITASLSTI